MKKIWFLSLVAVLFIGVPAAFPATELRDGLTPSEFISVKELRSLQKKNESLVILDARTLKSFKEGRIEGARLPREARYYQREELFRRGDLKKLDRSVESLAEGMKDVSRDAAIVTYCGAGCGSSSVLFYELERLGFRDVRVLDEGFEHWVESGYPVGRG